VQRVSISLIALLGLIPSLRADDSKAKTDLKSKPNTTASDDLQALVDAANGKKMNKPIHQLTGALDQQLYNKGTANETAKQILARKTEFNLGPVVENRLNTMTGNNVAAAQLLLQALKAKLITTSMKKGGVAIGQVVVEDGKLDPEFVLAQMPILEGGYFAAEVGDMTKPIKFRAAGYEDVEAPLAGKAGEFLDVGTVTLKRVPTDKLGSMKGKATLDIADRGPATVALSFGVPMPPNTPHGGYSPRRRWPAPVKVEVGADGSFSANGLTPGDYYFQLQAKDHASVMKPSLKIEPGKENDLGTIKLRTTDLGYYIGKPAPKGEHLVWEKDFKTAKARAASEHKPVMLMLTATWCGWCKKLEADTLEDSWVKHFLANVVVVQAFEDKGADTKVHEQFGANGYPTLIFLDSTGKEMHRIVGYKQSVPFLSECVKAFKKLEMKLPPELQLLIDKKVVSGG